MNARRPHAPQAVPANESPAALPSPWGEGQGEGKQGVRTDACSADLSTTSRLPIAILGVPFDNVTTAQAIQLIEQMVDSRRPHYLVTANVDFLVQAREDVELRRILFDAHLVLCDGTPLLWASRLLGNPLAERVAGSDLVPLLIKIAAEKGYRLFFLGAAPEAAEQAVANLRQQHPGLIIAGHYSPPFNKLLEMDHDEIKRRIVEAHPDLLFVSFGCPKQEKWIAMHYRDVGVPVCAGVGATIDFLAGQVKRAPVWMQRTGTEWIYRLAQEPRRLAGRYGKDLWVFGWSLVAQWWRLEFHSPKGRDGHGTFFVQSEPAWQRITLPERLDLVAAQNELAPLDHAVTDGRHCLLDMANVQFIDSTGMGLLIRLQKKIAATGRELVLLAPSPAALRALALMHLQDFFSLAPDEAAAQEKIVARTRERAVEFERSLPAPAILWHGEITALNAQEVWDRTRPFITSPSPVRTDSAPSLNAPPPMRELTIDLSGVRFIDSSGLGVMVRAKKLAARQGKKLLFTGLQPAVQNVLDIARLNEFLLGKD